ncbi:MAG TPA: hypothetical protein VJ183_05600 [Chloroflexia bacterium]|nr:hypothetical protein [Chloroflexia bacterium]
MSVSCIVGPRGRVYYTTLLTTDDRRQTTDDGRRTIFTAEAQRFWGDA